MDLKRYIPGLGNGHAKLAVVSDCPSFDDIESGLALSGSIGREFDRIIKQLSIYREEIWITNVSKYYVPPSQNKRKTFSSRALDAEINLEEQIEDLRRELITINPNCILALGGNALWALTGKNKISDYRGSILTTWLGKKLVATYHPRDLLGYENSEISGYWARQVMIFDIRRAYTESLTSELDLPSRNLSICESSAQLYDFTERYKTAEKLSVDIEAEECVPVCIGISANKHEGLTIPLWNCDGISKISDSELTSCWILLARLLYGNHKKVGANFKYDQDKITRLGLSINKLYSDVMLKSFVLNPELPKNLAFNTSIFTREPFYKNEGMYEGSRYDLFIGCARDACVTLEIDDTMESDLVELEMEDFYYNFVMKLHQLYLEIENEGFLVDYKKREELIRKYISWDERLRFELFTYIGAPINCNSWKQVDSLLYDNLKIPRRKGTSEEVLTQLLNNVVREPLRRKIIENILENRRVRKTISTYITAIPDFDGKMRTTYFICLDTGRTSTGQQDPPIRPIQIIEELDDNGKRKKKKKPLGTAFQTMTKHGDIGPEIRSQYIPEKNHCFLQADSSQAEARVIFNLADDQEALEAIDKHDYHALTASWFFGGTEDDYSKKKLGYESPIRFAGKTLRHAGHLGASKRRAAIEVNTQARKFKIDYVISEAEADRALKIFHRMQPKIKQVFQNGVINAIQVNRQLIAALPYGIEARTGGKRTFFERWNEELFRQAFSYIPQRTVSDNTKAAALRIKDRIPGIKIIVESHDALLFMIPIEKKLEYAIIIKEEFERPINFSKCSLSRPELIIPCEIEEGYNYYELSKFKFISSGKELKLI